MTTQRNGSSIVSNNNSFDVSIGDEKGMSKSLLLSDTSICSSTDSQLHPQDGCLILGTKAGRGNKYVTRFCIQRGVEAKVAKKGICAHEFCPCCYSEEPLSCGRKVWAVVRSEAFILTFHISAILLGALKEVLDYRHSPGTADIELVHSVIELFVTCLVIIIRTVSVFHAFKELREHREAIEHITEDGESKTDVVSPSLQKKVKVFVAIGVTLVLFAIVCFILFIYFAHLGWTILSNNLVLLIITIAANLMGKRIDNEIARIREDQHTTVVYETVLLLTECAQANTPAQKKAIFDKVGRFTRALRDTEMFEKPDYINVPSSWKPHWDTFTTMEAVSYI